MKLVAIVGTNSSRSTNRKLLKFMVKHFANQAEIDLLEIKDLPAFNQPEDKKVPSEVEAFSNKILAADGVIIATPEYDHTIPAPLSSALEWVAYTSRALVNKPTMIVGASLGLLGTSRAQAHLRQILDAPELKARVMPGTEFFLSHSEQSLTDDCELTVPEKVLELEDNFAEFQEFVTLTQSLVKKKDTDRKKAFIWETWLKA
ncbi:NADPH-dependent FMN reductase [Streptococcus saliviloxodontae]|uniref:NAD(P)H-dependent FMN reductase n=1 Tax=Streptococcus saliviloxodontae TaxID=1349416 RepID=A0ABS2PMX8_9STRE|nr:NADPH-dependent FMN reductase [Streptococcus saliviloxodontae]MBM7636451.1 NAD(P)H-dependent FMN reductase [Streptococcus saliviloxodontae]